MRRTGARNLPKRPLTLIAGFAPDGHMNILARVMDPRRRQPLVVVNRPGAQDAIGYAGVARAAAGC